MNTTVVSDAVVADANTSASPLLVVEDLHTSFSIPRGEVKAVRGVSFELEQGKTLGVVGESGSGKTVLARSIMRLNLGNNVTTTGSAKFRGLSILDQPPKSMRQLWGNEMAMVFQDPMTALNPLVKIGRQVTEHVRHHLGISKKEARSLAVDLLNEVRIPEPESRLDSYPHELSGGMRQRICIAIALACEPTLLFADEPTTALDVTVQHQILNLLNREQETRDMAMVLVTHDLGVVAGRTDETMVMYAGNVVEKTSTHELFNNMQHPYTEALFRSIPKTSERSHTRLTAIAGRPPDLIDPPTGCSFSPRCPYVQPKCREEKPPLIPVNDGSHLSSCWFPVGTEENKAAFRKNVAEGLPQTLVVEEALTDSSNEGSES